ncbi:MAG: hypothetical protein WDZ90_01580 [Candidatus Paceibacterota bacterium]
MPELPIPLAIPFGVRKQASLKLVSYQIPIVWVLLLKEQIG